MEKKFPSKWIHKASRVAIHTPEKADCKPKLVNIDKEGRFIWMKGIIHQKDI
jgi:hypothetical protein